MSDTPYPHVVLTYSEGPEDFKEIMLVLPDQAVLRSVVRGTETTMDKFKVREHPGTAEDLRRIIDNAFEDAREHRIDD